MSGGAGRTIDNGTGAHIHIGTGGHIHIFVFRFQFLDFKEINSVEHEYMIMYSPPINLMII